MEPVHGHLGGLPVLRVHDLVQRRLGLRLAACNVGNAMLFERRLRTGITDGSITMALRRWKRSQVVAGRRYRTGTDIIEVRSVATIDKSAITDDDAQRAGYGSVRDLLADLRGTDDVPIYRITFQRIDEPDPRELLANDEWLTSADVRDIESHLQRLDRASRAGLWTAATLSAIQIHVAVRAADLAEQLGADTADLKRNVRRLKALGVTVSLGTGYRLSLRGPSYLSMNAHEVR